MSTRRFLIRGTVQGVGFRWFVGRVARRLGLRGFARNLADGAVEVVAAGSDPALDELAAALALGPPAAHVTAVDVSGASDEAAGGDGFRIQ